MATFLIIIGLLGLASLYTVFDKSQSMNPALVMFASGVCILAGTMMLTIQYIRSLF